jgi:hypothetical protein
MYSARIVCWAMLTLSEQLIGFWRIFVLMKCVSSEETLFDKSVKTWTGRV